MSGRAFSKTGLSSLRRCVLSPRGTRAGRSNAAGRLARVFVRSVGLVSRVRFPPPPDHGELAGTLRQRPRSDGLVSRAAGTARASFPSSLGPRPATSGARTTGTVGGSRRGLFSRWVTRERLAFATLIADRDLHESILQHAHIGLTDGEHLRAVEALRAAGAEEDTFYKTLGSETRVILSGGLICRC